MTREEIENNIIAMELRISRRRLIIEQMELDNVDKEQAKESLARLVETLEHMYLYRQQWLYQQRLKGR